MRGEINWPIIYGIGFNIKTGEIFPATYPDKGPDLQLRDARNFTGAQTVSKPNLLRSKTNLSYFDFCFEQVLDIYDSSLGMLKIGPFNYDPLRGVDLWLQQNDEFLLQQLSTSPEVEPPHFPMQVCFHFPFFFFLYLIFPFSQIRATLKYIQEHQFPAITVFRDNRPHYFRIDENTGCWQTFRY